LLGLACGSAGQQRDRARVNASCTVVHATTLPYAG
jgi:hypothetical protein